MNRNVVYVLWIIIAIILLLPIISYVFYFRNNPISSFPEDWGSFGDYIGGCYSIFTAIMTIVITYYLHKQNSKQSKLELCTNEIISSYYKILECFDLYNVNKRDGVNNLFAKYNEELKSNCLIIEYYIKIHPYYSQTNGHDFMMASYNLRNNVDQEHFNAFVNSFNSFIKNMPFK